VNDVYVQTNEPENRVIAFRREADGSLAQLGAFAAGGAGHGVPHLTSQGSVVLAGDGRHLLVTNAASGDVSVFATSADGLELVQTIATGDAPKSVAEHGGLVYVLNTGDPSLAGFLLGAGGLEPLERSSRALGADADPAQVGFSPDGSVLVVSQRGTDSLAVYPVRPDGLLGEPGDVESSGPTPYGFAFAGDALVVTEAFRAETGKAAASSYRLSAGSLTPVTRSAGNGRSEICWAVVTPDARFAFTTNFADGAVSRYAIGPDGGIALEEAAAGIAVAGEKGLRDEDLTADGRFLYAVDVDAGRIFGWAVAADGSLSPLGSWDGIPATAAGLAAS
jgi:6-phosphogluconolactonase (cycloisomerase 2 family)